jgi:hypothetical protein
MKDAPKPIELEDHGCQTIRKALLWGLHSYGEIQRLSERYEYLKRNAEPVDQDMRPMDSVGRTDGVVIFAEALQLVSANDLAPE